MDFSEKQTLFERKFKYTLLYIFCILMDIKHSLMYFNVL